ncbi:MULTISPECIES: ABC transporter ATP-binding protein [unclassified Corynebacterium]|uniref:ABC transporter ATP-binding protein n=1 Tax=unclassified Corynebacterium TaxID=2624378 RepID=UPI00309CA0AC
MKADESPALKLRGVTKRYGDVEAVSGLDLTLQRGQVLALLGPNGAGKTTTVEMCEGFVQPDAGELRVLGLDPWRETDELRTRIGVMLQGGGAYPGVRVGEMLKLVASYSANPMDIDWLLDVVGLSKHVKTSYRRLSGGQQQRLSLACALVGRPELVFLDEPTAGLDAQSRLAVWDLVNSMKRDGVTIVLTTHLMDEAEALADEVIIIDKGHVVASGSTNEITASSNPDTYFAADEDIDAAGLSAQLHAQGFDVTVLPVSPNRWRISGKTTPAIISAVASWCAQRDALITELTVSRRSLEDVFLDITGREMRN